MSYSTITQSILAQSKGGINVDLFGFVRVVCHRQSSSVGKASWRSLPEVIDLGLVQSSCFDSIAVGTLRERVLVGLPIDRANSMAVAILEHNRELLESTTQTLLDREVLEGEAALGLVAVP